MATLKIFNSWVITWSLIKNNQRNHKKIVCLHYLPDLLYLMNYVNQLLDQQSFLRRTSKTSLKLKTSVCGYRSCHYSTQFPGHFCWLDCLIINFMLTWLFRVAVPCSFHFFFNRVTLKTPFRINLLTLIFYRPISKILKLSGVTFFYQEQNRYCLELFNIQTTNPYKICWKLRRCSFQMRPFPGNIFLVTFTYIPLRL